MSKYQTIAELSVRVARAEMERDQAYIERDKARDEATVAWQAQQSIFSGNKEKILETLHLIGIPAKDLVAMYEIEQIWLREGGDQSMLEWWHNPTVRA